MKQIPLHGKKGTGKFVSVDDADYDWLNQYRWSFTGRGYAATRMPRTKTTTLMHRLIMGTPKGMSTDHTNGDGLDNQRSNLRIATYGENNVNKGKFHPGSSSKYKGVCFRKRAKIRKWRCNVAAFEIGSFSTETEAALAYDKFVKEKYGDFAVLNFPEQKTA